IEIINELFRSVHTIKGNSLTNGFLILNKLAHKFEEILDKLRKQKIKATDEIIEISFECVDNIFDIFDCIKENSNDEYNIDSIITRIENILSLSEKKLVAIKFENFKIDFNDIKKFSLSENDNIYKLNIKLKEDVLIPAISMFSILSFLKEKYLIIKTYPTEEDLNNEDIPDEQFQKNFYILTKLDKIDEIICELKENFVDDIEEIQIEKENISKIIEDQKKQAQQVKISSEDFIRVPITRLNKLLSIIHNLIIIKNRFELKLKNTEDYELKEILSQLRLNTLELNKNIMEARLVEINTILNRFPSMARKLAKELNKNIELEIKGGETLVDRTIIDVIGDPLVHIIRNSIDHGIENEEERKKKNKEPKGKIIIEVKKTDTEIQIIISDDGQGINLKKVKEKAIKNGLITEEKAEQMNEKEIIELITLPGFSTAEKITELSGRGVGMDVVKNTIEKIRGSLTINTELNKGTTMIITIPTSINLSTVLLCIYNNNRYLIQQDYVYELLEISKQDIFIKDDKFYIDLSNKEVLNLEFKKIIPVFYIIEPNNNEKYYLLLFKKENKYFAINVDKIITQLEVIIKPLNKYFLKNINIFNGSALLGDNLPALLLNINYFFNQLE
ncbi:MAG TPA: chemotaxis protein CheA, partial [bacterium]|nr:chemotaxis protein CheA [bacterium]